MWNELRLKRGAGTLGRALWVMSLVAVAVALVARSAFAQEHATVDGVFDLRGTVVDQQGQPLVGAFVALADSEWGSLTDEKGRFRIPDLRAGRVELTAEQIGYATLTWRGDVTVESGPLVLAMEAKAIMLEGLNVVTDRFRSRRNSTATAVTLLDREDLVTATQPTVVDFVRSRAGLAAYRCPGLANSSLCFMSRGRIVEPRVYIDEMPVIGGLDYLESFRPHELYMVEVYARGRHIRAYTTQFMERAAQQRLQPIALLF